MTQSNEAFLIACQVGEGQATDAIKVREAIANLAGIAPKSIRAEDRFNVELMKFEFWGSLDSIVLVMSWKSALASESQTGPLSEYRTLK